MSQISGGELYQAIADEINDARRAGLKSGGASEEDIRTDMTLYELTALSAQIRIFERAGLAKKPSK